MNSEVADRALNLGVPQQDLHGSEISCLLVDHRGLGSTQGVCAVVLGFEPDRGHPLIDKAAILSSAEMP